MHHRATTQSPERRPEAEEAEAEAEPQEPVQDEDEQEAEGRHTGTGTGVQSAHRAAEPHPAFRAIGEAS